MTNQVIPNKPFELVIDADSFLYAAAIDAEEELEWSEDNWTLNCDHKKAKDHFLNKIVDLIHLSGCSLYTLCFTGPKNFRYDLFPDYKSNRVGKRKPVGFLALKEWALTTELPNDAKGRAMLWPGIEADDVVGILATEKNTKHQRVIHSIDKDLKNIPGIHLEIYEENDLLCSRFVLISEQEGYRNFLEQVLIGDTSDGYKGCPGYGPVKAKKLLDKNTSWRSVVGAFTTAGMSEDDALTQARLAHILHCSDYNQETGEVKLWSDTTIGF